MIQANDLRIGNYFIDDQNEVLKIDKIDGVENTVSANGIDGIEIADLNPIHFSEKLLLKSNFSKVLDILKWENKNESNIEYKYIEIVIVSKSEIKIWRGARYIGILYCKYLHEFQNIFHILTNTELEINL